MNPSPSPMMLGLRLSTNTALEASEKMESSDTSLDFSSLGTLNSSSNKSGPIFDPSSTSANNSSSKDNTMKDLILSYKKRRTPMGDIKAPPKPQRIRSFKLDGVPSCVSNEIQQKARENREQRRKRQEQKSFTSITATNELGDSLSSLQSNTSITRRQRPKVGFLCLPNGHPLHWDKAQLSAQEFPEEDRAYLAKTLKTPQLKTVRGLSLPEETVSALRELHAKDWDLATLGRAATVLFHPKKNPLDLSPAVTSYFYKRFLSMKLDLEDDVGVSYKGRRYFLHHQEGEYPLTELMHGLREDFQAATQRYDGQQSSPYTIISSRCA